MSKCGADNFLEASSKTKVTKIGAVNASGTVSENRAHQDGQLNLLNGSQALVENHNVHLVNTTEHKADDENFLKRKVEPEFEIGSSQLKVKKTSRQIREPEQERQQEVQERPITSSFPALLMAAFPSTSAQASVPTFEPEIVHPQNSDVAIEPEESSGGVRNGDDANHQDDEELSRLTSRLHDARLYDCLRDRHMGNSCIPRRVNFSRYNTPNAPAVSEDEDEEKFVGPSGEGRRPTGVSGKSKIGHDGIHISSSQPQLHQHQPLILVNNQPVTAVEDTGQNSGLIKSMSSPNLKSPGRPVTPKKDDKDETFWDKIGTLGRKKRIKEVQNFEQEGRHAIDSPGSPTQFDISPDEYDLAEGDERSLIERRSYADPKLQHLISLLIDWINDELADQRIIVKSIEDDLYDGQILQKLLEKLTGQKLEVPEVSQSEEGQRHKLSVVLNACTQVLGLARWSQQKWSVESIHSKNLVSILYLLVHLVRHFRAPLRLPENVNVETVVVKKRNGKLEYRRVTEEITSTYDEFGMRCERDAFDALLDHAPDKLQVVKKSLITFVNKHLNKINLEVTDIENQFHDGVYLILLMGLLEGYFVPLFEFHLTPKDFEQKVFNVAFSFELMQDAGISKPKARPEDIVNVDLKSTLRVLYNLFAKYKNVN